jgi:DNA polymerase-4
MNGGARPRRILHIDLHPFFVAVERARDRALQARPVIVGGSEPWGRVAAASSEARAEGVCEGQTLAEARRRCPHAVVCPGDFETYGRVSEELTSVLRGVSRRIERPSGDEAFVDLSSTPTLRHAVLATESLKDAIHSRLGLDAAFGLASSRLAARIASRWARPRGLLLLLPEHEPSFVARQPVSVLEMLSASTLATLRQLGATTIGELRSVDAPRLSAAVGRAGAERLWELLDPSRESPVALASPPTFVQEDQTVRDPSTDRQALETLLDALVGRASRRLSCQDLDAGSVTVEVRRSARTGSRAERLGPATREAATIRATARRLAGPLLEPPELVRGLRVRLANLTAHNPQAQLFPQIAAGGRS